MQRQVISKISGMLLVLICVLLTPVFATWIYYQYEFFPAESATHHNSVFLQNFHYAPSIVTLPGDETTPPPITTTPPISESTPEEGEPEESTPEQTTPEQTEPPTPPPVEGENHSHLIRLLTTDYSAIYDNKKLNLNNQKHSVLYKEIIEKNREVVYSEVSSYTAGNIDKELEKGLQAADADRLEFVVAAKFENETAIEIVIYSYKATVGSNAKVGDTWEVYQTYLKYENGVWGRDVYRTYVGEAKLIQAPGYSFLIPDYQNIVYK